MYYKQCNDADYAYAKVSLDFFRSLLPPEMDFYIPTSKGKKHCRSVMLFLAEFSWIFHSRAR